MMAIERDLRMLCSGFEDGRRGPEPRNADLGARNGKEADSKSMALLTPWFQPVETGVDFFGLQKWER